MRTATQSCCCRRSKYDVCGKTDLNRQSLGQFYWFGAPARTRQHTDNGRLCCSTIENVVCCPWDSVKSSEQCLQEFRSKAMVYIILIGFSVTATLLLHYLEGLIPCSWDFNLFSSSLFTLCDYQDLRPVHLIPNRFIKMDSLFRESLYGGAT